MDKKISCDSLAVLISSIGDICGFVAYAEGSAEVFESLIDKHQGNRVGLTDCIELILEAMIILQENSTNVFDKQLLKQEEIVRDDHEFHSIGNTGRAPLGTIREENKREDYDRDESSDADDYDER